MRRGEKENNEAPIILHCNQLLTLKQQIKRGNLGLTTEEKKCKMLQSAAPSELVELNLKTRDAPRIIGKHHHILIKNTLQGAML